MKIHWSVDSMPELANLSRKQRQKVLSACTRKYAFKHWQTWAGLVGVTVLAVIIGSFISRFAGAVITGGICGGLGYGIISVIINTAIYPDIKRYVERELKQ